MGDEGQKIKNAIDSFTDDVTDNIKDISTLGELQNKLDTLNKDIKTTDTKYRAFEQENSDAATKYFDMKTDYAHKKQKIENESKAALEKLKKKFGEKAEPIIKDHDIYVGSEKLDLETLFNRIIESRSTVSNIKLIAKKGGGLFGRKSQEDNKARSSVLKYVGGEILEGIGPIKKDEQKRLVTLESKFTQLKTLERECQKKEMKLKELARPRDKISTQIAKIREDKAFRLSSQDGVLKIRENYLNHFNTAHALVKDYIETSGKALEGYEPPEKDVEKRELRAKKKELTTTVKDLKTKVATAEKELETKTQELENIRTTMEDNIQKLEETKTELEAKLEETASKLKETESSRDDYKTQTENLTTTKKTLEADIKGLEKEKSSLQKQFDDTSSKLATSEDKREEYKQKSIELTQGLDSLKKEMTEQFKDIESSLTTKIEDIKNPKA